MSPTLAKKLMSELPEMKELVAFIQEECAKLNTITDITPEVTDEFSITIEVIARKRAYVKLQAILDPLLTVDLRPTGTTPSEYLV